MKMTEWSDAKRKMPTQFRLSTLRSSHHYQHHVSSSKAKTKQRVHMTAQTPFITHTFTSHSAQISHIQKVPNSFMVLTPSYTPQFPGTYEVSMPSTSQRSQCLSETTPYAHSALHSWEIVEVDVVNQSSSYQLILPSFHPFASVIS